MEITCLFHTINRPPADAALSEQNKIKLPVVFKITKWMGMHLL